MLVQWLSAALGLLFHACMLLSNSGRHKRTTVWTLLLCSGPIEGCSLVLAVRRYCAFRSLVCAYVVCAEEEKQVRKKNFVVVCVPLAYGNQSWWYSKLSPRRPPPLQSCSPSGWCSPVPWLALRRAPVSRTCHAHTNTHERASGCCCYLWCCIIAFGCGAAAINTTLYVALFSLVTRNEKTKDKNGKKEKDETRVFCGFEKDNEKRTAVS